MSMSATKDLNSRRYAVRPVVMMTACIAALLLAVPLFTLEADARGGGGGGGRGSGGFGGDGIGGGRGWGAWALGARALGGARAVWPAAGGGGVPAGAAAGP